MVENDIKKAITYARQSISRIPDESLSIEFQQSEAVKYIEARGWVLAGSYSDPDVKGWRRNRPGFDAMLDALRTGSADVLVLYKLSRFARNLMMQEEVVAEIAEAGGDLVSITEPHISTSPMIRQILGAVNENYRRDQSDWLKSTFAARARKGLPHGYAPFGYQKEDLQLVPDDATSPLARQVWEWALSGEGSVEITYRLNERGISPPRASVWTPSAVLRMLHNPAYAGHVQHRGEIVARDTHPAIVTDAEYDEVQRTLDRRSSHRRKAQPSWAEGFVWHGCGRRMFLAGWHRKDGEDRPRFRCAHAFARERRGVMACTHRPASTFAAYVEEGIATALVDLFRRFRPVEDVVSALEHQQGASEREHDRRRQRLDRRLSDLERQRQRLLDLVLQGTIDPALYGDRDAALKVEIATVNAALHATPAPVSRPEVAKVHHELSDVGAIIAVVAREQPERLVPTLSRLGARYVIGDGPNRLDVAPEWRAYFASSW